MKTGDAPQSHAVYPNLDLARFVCALLVVLIHTSPLENCSELGQLYFENVVARIAVPLFFAISGFLFFGKLDYVHGRIAHNRKNLGRLIKILRKNILLYILWSVLYLSITLPEWSVIGWCGWAAIKDWLHAFLLIGSYYHLWYLLALILAIPALYLLLSVIPVSTSWTVASVLWVLECLVYSYAWIGIGQIPVIAFICGKLPVIFDAFFRALPLLCVGAILSRRTIKAPNVSICVGAFLLCAAEASALYFFTPNEASFSYLFSTPIMVWFILSYLLAGKQVSLNEHQQFCLRDMSLSVYCVHPMVCWLCQKLSVPTGILFWLTVTSTSVAIAYVWSRRKCVFEIWRL